MSHGWPALLVGASLVAFACGRTGLRLETTGAGGEGGSADEPPVDECTTDADCSSDDACAPAICLPADGEDAVRICSTRPVSCDDRDACTVDRCEPLDGRCVHEGAADLDRDGVIGPAPAGLPASCGGPDCDDDDGDVFPGAVELCDGKDNDCNGSIDEGATYGAPAPPVLIAPDSYFSDYGGFAFDGARYGVTYTDTGQDLRQQSYFELLNADGSRALGPSLVSEINADTTAGAIVSSGSSFLTVWADARQAANYEIYATRFNDEAQKLEPDQRLTDAPYFSVRPSVSFTGEGYVVVWQDHRFEASTGINAILGRPLTQRGLPGGDEVRLTGEDEDAEFQDSAVSESRLGLTYVVRGPLLPDGSEPPTSVRFRSFDLELSDAASPVELGTDGQEPAIVRTDDSFVVAWHTGNEFGNWGGSLQAAVLDDRGTLLAAGPVTTGDLYARSRSLVSLGDRVLIVWSAMETDASPYRLFYEIVSARDLSVLTPRQPLAQSMFDLTAPSARLGPNGDVGILFNEAAPRRAAYFTRLGCALNLR